MVVVDFSTERGCCESTLAPWWVEEIMVSSFVLSLQSSSTKIVFFIIFLVLLLVGKVSLPFDTSSGIVTTLTFNFVLSLSVDSVEAE